MIDDDSDPYDEQGHGTHVAGTIAAVLSDGDVSSGDTDVEREHGSDEGAMERDRPERPGRG